MTFYKKQPFGNAIVYVTPDERAYQIPIYTEEHPDGHTETVSGTASQIEEYEKNRFVEDAEEIERSEVPIGVLSTLKRILSEDQAPQE